VETGSLSGPVGTGDQRSCADGPFGGPGLHKNPIGTPKSLILPFLAFAL
jgi:hypothetical protein